MPPPGTPQPGSPHSAAPPPASPSPPAPDAEPAAEIALVCHGPLGPAHGSVVGLTRDRLRARFDADEAPAMPIAAEVGVDLVSPDSGREGLRARVVARRQAQDGGVVYDFHLGFEDLDFGHGVLNHRQDFRVFPDSRCALEVRVQGLPAGPIHRATLRDVSASGIGLWLMPGVEASLYGFDRLGLDFYLPGDPAPFELEGFVRHRTLTGCAISYGVALDAAARADFDQQRRRLVAYCRRREREVITRVKRNRRAG